MQKNVRGFTLIELLVVVSIIGLLASIALPRYRLIKERALVSTMKADLRNLVASQEGFYITNNDYAGSASPNPEVPGTNGSGSTTWTPSPGVELVQLSYRSGAAIGVGWNAIVKHDGVRSTTIDECGVFQGDLTFSPNAAVTDAGVSACW